jgi:hypothetical protein
MDPRDGAVHDLGSPADPVPRTFARGIASAGIRRARDLVQAKPRDEAVPPDERTLLFEKAQIRAPTRRAVDPCRRATAVSERPRRIEQGDDGGSFAGVGHGSMEPDRERERTETDTEECLCGGDPSPVSSPSDEHREGERDKRRGQSRPGGGDVLEHDAEREGDDDAKQRSS